MASTKDRLQEAKNLIQQKRYDDARAILRTVNHDIALQWLDKLDEIDPPKSAAPKKKRSNAVPILMVILILGVIGFIVYVSVQQRVTQITAQLSNSLAATATGTIPPMPPALSTVQQDAVIVKCLKEVYDNSGMYRDFSESVVEKSKSDDFNTLGIVASVYMRDYCHRDEAFTVIWTSYKEVKEKSLSAIIDKQVAWSRFIEGWGFSVQNEINQTATMSSYLTARPTEQ